MACGVREIGEWLWQSFGGVDVDQIDVWRLRACYDSVEESEMVYVWHVRPEEK